MFNYLIAVLPTLITEALAEVLLVIHLSQIWYLDDTYSNAIILFIY